MRSCELQMEWMESNDVVTAQVHLLPFIAVGVYLFAHFPITLTITAASSLTMTAILFRQISVVKVITFVILRCYRYLHCVHLAFTDNYLLYK